MTETEGVTKPVPNHPGSLFGPSGNATLHPWGMSYNFTSQIVNGGSYIPYHPGLRPQVNRSVVTHPWGFPPNFIHR